MNSLLQQPWFVPVALVLLLVLAMVGVWAARRYNTRMAHSLNFAAILLAVSILVGLAMLSGCAKARKVAPAAPEYDAVALAGAAKGEVIAIGTLATIGSFEWDSSPLATLAAASLKHVPQLLHDHQVTADEAQLMINSAVKIRSLLKAANGKCSQNGAGQCTGDESAARTILGQAKTEMVSGCLSLTDREILTCLHR